MRHKLWFAFYEANIDWCGWNRSWNAIFGHFRRSKFIIYNSFVRFINKLSDGFPSPTSLLWMLSRQLQQCSVWQFLKELKGKIDYELLVTWLLNRTCGSWKSNDPVWNFSLLKQAWCSKTISILFKSTSSTACFLLEYINCAFWTKGHKLWYSMGGKKLSFVVTLTWAWCLKPLTVTLAIGFSRFIFGSFKVFFCSLL